jgi:hypothetical protein
MKNSGTPSASCRSCKTITVIWFYKKTRCLRGERQQQLRPRLQTPNAQHPDTLLVPSRPEINALVERNVDGWSNSCSFVESVSTATSTHTAQCTRCAPHNLQVITPAPSPTGPLLFSRISSHRMQHSCDDFIDRKLAHSTRDFVCRNHFAGTGRTPQSTVDQVLQM